MPGRRSSFHCVSTAAWPVPLPLRTVWLCGLLICAAGCASGPQGEVYTVDKLPTNLIAAKRDNVKTIDLSRLASAKGDSEIIDKGDVLKIDIAAGLNEKDVVTLSARVREDGQAEVPVIGPVPVAGLEMQAAESEIAAACIQRELYKAPHVTVTMKHQRTNKITVVGAVKEPGVYAIPRRSSDLLAALVAAGGLSDLAGTKVEIRNPKKSPTGDFTPPPIASGSEGGVDAVGFSIAADPASARMDTIKVDLVAATKSGIGGYEVLDGGVVMVEKRDPEPVHVLGLVKSPNRYEFPIAQDLRLLDAIALAGGTTNPVANKVFIVRRVPNSAKTAIVSTNISEAKRDDAHNPLLSPGDIISIEQTPATVLIDALRVVNFGVGASVPLIRAN